MLKNKKKLTQRYNTAKNTKVGEEIICPSCGTKFIKNSYQTVFCKTKGGSKCKDNYWNNVTPSKRNNTTRISPANAAYYNNVILPEKAREFGFPDVETMQNHVEEFDAFSVEVENCFCCGLRPEYCRCEDV